MLQRLEVVTVPKILFSYDIIYVCNCGIHMCRYGYVKVLTHNNYSTPQPTKIVFKDDF